MHSTPQPLGSSLCDRRHTPAPRPCKIVTFYEDFAAAIRAYRSFDGLARKFGSDRSVHPTSWSFSMLARPELDSAVARDSAGADVIVVAANGDGELPPHIAGWVERCISREPNSEPVVVALSDREPQADGPAIPICASLMRIANRRHARFISGGALAEGADDELPVQPVQGSPESLISTLQKMLPYSTTASHWHSGIND